MHLVNKIGTFDLVVHEGHWQICADGVSCVRPPEQSSRRRSRKPAYSAIRFCKAGVEIKPLQTIASRSKLAPLYVLHPVAKLCC